MRAMVIESFGGPERLKPATLPRPRPGRGEVLLRVVAAGVGSVDGRICRGELQNVFPHRFPLIPGWDVAGVIEEFGEGAGRFRKGDRIWAMARKPEVQWGSWAEYVTVPEAAMAMMPSKLLYEEAAAVPVAGLAAYQALFARPGLERGSTVLIHGGGGGVGHLAVQLARVAGARIVATASPANAPFVMGLGAEATIDHTRGDFEESARRTCPDGFDLVLDTIGGETLRESYSIVRRGGRLVSLIDDPDKVAAATGGFAAHFLFTEPSAEQLDRLGRLFDTREISVHVQKIYPLASAAEALRVACDGHVQGRLVLNL